jgi:hypothetical protein
MEIEPQNTSLTSQQRVLADETLDNTNENVAQSTSSPLSFKEELKQELEQERKNFNNFMGTLWKHWKEIFTKNSTNDYGKLKNTLSQMFIDLFFDQNMQKISRVLAGSQLAPLLWEFLAHECRQSSLEIGQGQNHWALKELGQFGCWLGEGVCRALFVVFDAAVSPIQAAVTALATWADTVMKEWEAQKGSSSGKKALHVVKAVFLTGLAKGLLKGIGVLATKCVHIPKNVVSLLAAVAGRPIYSIAPDGFKEKFATVCNAYRATNAVARKGCTPHKNKMMYSCAINEVVSN